ncbi:hypothetical protein ABBQ38_002000 [Trebouxia sp. C0009 RCD-2024]
MQSERSCPSLKITTIADLHGDSDQPRCEEQSVTVSHTRGCGSTAQCANPNLMNRCNLHTTATLSSLSMEDLQTSLQTVMFENNYLAARVDMLRHQHKYTSQMLANPLTPPVVSTAPNCSMQGRAASPSCQSKKRPLATSSPPMTPDPCEAFHGFCAKTPVTSASPNYPDFMALCTKQPVYASLEVGMHKKYKQTTAHCQHHSFYLCKTAMPHSAKQASTAIHAKDQT